MPYAIKPAEDALLRSMYVFPYMTGKQLTQLLYSPGSYKEVLAKLKRLTDNNYVLRKPLPSQIQAGSVPYVYWLVFVNDIGGQFLMRIGARDSIECVPDNQIWGPGDHKKGNRLAFC